MPLTLNLEPNVIIEVWNKGVDDRLVGICKLEIKGEGGVDFYDERNLFPRVYLEGDYPVGTIRGGKIGYLGVVVGVGSVEQVNRYVQKHRQVGRQEKEVKEGEKNSELKPEETQLPKRSNNKEEEQ